MFKLGKTNKSIADEELKQAMVTAVKVSLFQVGIKLAVFALIRHAIRKTLHEKAKTDPYIAEMLKRIEG